MTLSRTAASAIAEAIRKLIRTIEDSTGQKPYLLPIEGTPDPDTVKLRQFITQMHWNDQIRIASDGVLGILLPSRVRPGGVDVNCDEPDSFSDITKSHFDLSVKAALTKLARFCVEKMPQEGANRPVETMDYLEEVLRKIDGTERGEGGKPAAVKEQTDTTPAAKVVDPALIHTTRKQPSKKAITVYQYWFLTGKNQTELADDPNLMEELGRRVDQGTISRWLNRVKEWIEAGNVLPDLNPALNSKPTSIDPSKIDMGPRQDGLVERQRNRRTSDGDD